LRRALLVALAAAALASPSSAQYARVGDSLDFNRIQLVAEASLAECERIDALTKSGGSMVAEMNSAPRRNGWTMTESLLFNHVCLAYLKGKRDGLTFAR
jgi:hypothetical protein